MTRILVVEDNPRYADAAVRYLGSRGHTAITAKDYYEGEDRLATRAATPDGQHGLDGTIIDCFMPFITGSGDTDQGKSLIEKLAYEDPRERRMREGLEMFGQYVDLDYPEMRTYARFLIGTTRERDVSQCPVVKVMKLLVDHGMGKAAVTPLVKDAMSLVYREDQTPKDYYGALRHAVENSEANQPLGILLAESAERKHLPFVLATSTTHHDLLTQPVQDYAARKGWKLVDCGPNQEDDKASPEFWERAMGELERTMKGGRT